MCVRMAEGRVHWTICTRSVERWTYDTVTPVARPGRTGPRSASMGTCASQRSCCACTRCMPKSHRQREKQHRASPFCHRQSRLRALGGCRYSIYGDVYSAYDGIYLSMTTLHMIVSIYACTDRRLHMACILLLIWHASSSSYDMHREDATEYQDRPVALPAFPVFLALFGSRV
jgi:hypothetical protein